MSGALELARAELARFAESLPELGRAQPSLAGFFSRSDAAVLARAPGRLDVMGGIADYSGSLVLEQPIREAALVAVARADDDTVRVASWSDHEVRQVSFPAPELWQACTSYGRARAYFARHGDAHWAAYVAGALGALRVDFEAELSGGLRILLKSAVPEGKGVSSSAAIEVATLRALCELCGVAVDGPALALSCQRVENFVVGAPCGVMDQMTSACGQAARLLALLCQPAEILGHLSLPETVAVFGIDSGQRHAVTGSGYRQVRAAASMGLRILAERFGARAIPEGPGRVRLEQDPLSGYLANVAPEQLSSEDLAALPERLLGADFLRHYHGITDAVVELAADVSYPLRAATLHPIYEHARVRAFAERLATAQSDAELASLGALMHDSHASYSACGLGSSGTDQLVDWVREAGAARGLFGAKITGGGCGGTVAVLARPDALPVVRELALRYAQASGHAAHVFVGSSPGAMACEPLWLAQLSSRERAPG